MTAVDVRGDSVALHGLLLLEKQVKAAIGERKRRLLASMDVGDRKQARLDDGTDVGSVTVARGRVTASVTDPAAFTAWVASTFPDEVMRQVRPAFRDVILGRCKDAGDAVDTATGQVIPGVTVAHGDPYVTTLANRANEVALIEVMRGGYHLALDTTGDTE